MYCPVFRNHNSVPHLFAKLCFIVSIKSSNIFDIISDLCIRLHPSLPWAWLHKRTLVCKHRAVGEDAFSLIWDAREILGESTRIKELRRKLGREVFSFLAASHLYIWVNLNSLWEAHLHHHHTPLHRHHALESWAHMVARISVPITRNRWKVTISFFATKSSLISRSVHREQIAGSKRMADSHCKTFLVRITKKRSCSLFWPNTSFVVLLQFEIYWWNILEKYCSLVVYGFALG